ncbi:hypothetical protein [Streptomyces sp. NBC_00212]|uniref:hypothetical protein n=1 Tax=Streptomyces sp. NBC_00212 TaxID=2975684 RepID=UPI00324DF550
MKRKILAAGGIVLGGAALVLSMQGSAQAASTPPRAESTQVAATQDPEAQPQAIGSVLGKVAVHAKAACPSVAGAVGSVANDFFGTHSQPNKDLGSVNTIDTVFDK